MHGACDHGPSATCPTVQSRYHLTTPLAGEGRCFPSWDSKTQRRSRGALGHVAQARWTMGGTLQKTETFLGVQWSALLPDGKGPRRKTSLEAQKLILNPQSGRRENLLWSVDRRRSCLFHCSISQSPRMQILEPSLNFSRGSFSRANAYKLLPADIGHSPNPSVPRHHLQLELVQLLSDWSPFHYPPPASFMLTSSQGKAFFPSQLTLRAVASLHLFLKSKHFILASKALHNLASRIFPQCCP